MHHIAHEIIIWNSKAIVKYIYIWVSIIKYVLSVLKLVVMENSSHGCNFKVTLYLVYPILFEFIVLIDMTKLFFVTFN